ncbi:MAG: efflux RND transporter periplasmic adaptor subunit [Alcanivoracaceae bacterium]
MAEHFQRVQEQWRSLPPVPRIILATLVTIILLWQLKPSAPVKPETDTSARVSIEYARPGTFAPELLLFGRIQSPASATLSASIAAEVSAIPVLAGSRVSQGQPLVTLDTREAQLALDQAQAALDRAEADRSATRNRYRSDQKALKLEQELTDLAKQDVARLEQLREGNMASQRQLDDARQALARQQLNLENRRLVVDNHRHDMQRLDAEVSRSTAARDQAALDLERSAVAAPFDGRITTVHVAPGERVRPGEPLVSLYADSGVEISAQIPQRHLPAVRRGLDNAGTLPGTLFLEGQQLPLTLKRLAGEVQAGQGGVDGLFHLDNPGLIPELGRPLELILSLPPQENLVALPAPALHGLDRIYRVDSEQRLSAITVERVGEWRDAQGNRRLLVRGDIEPGMAIMTTQLPGAIDGQHVQPQGKSETPLPAGQQPAAADAEPTAA